MPKCKNDSSRSYKGDEPSPKGRGYCAHAEKEGVKKKGRDGQMWIVKATKTGTLRWVKDSSKSSSTSSSSRKKSCPKRLQKNSVTISLTKPKCSKVVRYEKRVKEGKITRISQITGLELEKGYIHKHIDFNEFANEAVKIPKGFKKKSLKKEFIKRFYCDETRELLTKDNPLVKKIKHPGAKKYQTHDNGGRPFLVYITKNEVTVYKRPGDQSGYFIKEKDRWEYWSYAQKIVSYKNPLKIFVGKSPVTPMTTFSGGYGPRFDGNSILLQISRDRYVHIGIEIYEFSTKGDKIKEYISPVGNSDVPYPVAIGEDNVYFMLDKTYVPINKFSKFTQDVKNDAYSYYYGHSGDEALSKYAKKMFKFRLVEKRDW